MKYMEKLSQKELLDETFGGAINALRTSGDHLKTAGSHLKTGFDTTSKVTKRAAQSTGGRLAAAGLKSLAKAVSPSAYADASRLKKGIQGAFKKGQSPAKIVSQWPQIYPDIVAAVSDVRQRIGGSKGGESLPDTMALVDLKLQLRNTSNNYEPYNTVIGPLTIPFKKGSDKKEGESVWMPAINVKAKDDLEGIARAQMTSNPDLAQSIVAFVNEITSGGSAPYLNSAQATTSSKSSQAVPPPLPKKPKSKKIIGRRRSGSKKNRRSENEESKISQKSLLEHLQSWAS